MKNRPYTNIALCPSDPITKPVEIYDIINETNKINSFKYKMQQANLNEEIKGTLIDVENWLPFASEIYNVSNNIKDYILVPVVFMYSDLPNKNGVSFPFKELTSFNSDVGRINYNTWKGKPTFYEHNNKDVTQAKGVILSTALRKLNGYKGDIWKVIGLLSFDRNRDAVLCNEILTGNLNSYSMGAFCNDYRCSITGNYLSQGKAEQYTKLGRPSFNIIDGHLAYLECIDMLGFECSCVNVPAYVMAINDNPIQINNK